MPEMARGEIAVGLREVCTRLQVVGIERYEMESTHQKTFALNFKHESFFFRKGIAR